MCKHRTNLCNWKFLVHGVLSILLHFWHFAETIFKESLSLIFEKSVQSILVCLIIVIVWKNSMINKLHIVVLLLNKL